MSKRVKSETVTTRYKYDEDGVIVSTKVDTRIAWEEYVPAGLKPEKEYKNEVQA